MAKNAPVPLHQQLPDDALSRMSRYAGKGVSTDQEDNLVPLIYILQSGSPQINKRSPDYIEGAEAGAILLRNSQRPIVDGEKGINFQPCYFTKKWVEWVPRDSGGGFVTQHDKLPADAQSIEDPRNPNRVRYVRRNGNECIETRYHIGYVLTDEGPLPYVIPMSSTGHTVSKGWMFHMNSIRLPTGEIAPSFGRSYRLTTKQRTNAAGTWFTWEVNDNGWLNDDAQIDAGGRLHEAFASGAKQTAAPEQQPGVATEDSDVM